MPLEVRTVVRRQRQDTTAKRLVHKPLVAYGRVQQAYYRQRWAAHNRTPPYHDPSALEEDITTSDSTAKSPRRK